MVRTTLRWAARCLVGIACIAAAGLIWLRTAPGQQWVASQLVEAIQSSMTRGTVIVGEVETNFLSAVEVSGFELHDSSGRLMRVERMGLSLQPWTILADQFVVESVFVYGIDADVQTNSDGQLNIVSLFDDGAEDEETQPFSGFGIDLIVDEFKVSTGAIRVDDVLVDSADVVTSATVKGSAIALDGLRVRVGLAAPESRDVEVSGAIRFADGDLMIEGLDVVDQAHRLSLSGRIRDVEAVPTFDVNVELQHVDSADINQIVGSEVLRVDLQSMVDFTGTVDSLRAMGDARGAAGDGRMTFDATISSAAEPMEWSVEMGFEDLQVDAFTGMAPGDTLVNGSIRITGEGVEYPEDVRAAINATLTNQRIAGVAVNTIELSAELDRGILRTKQVEIEADGVEIEAEGLIDVIESTADLHMKSKAPNARHLRSYGGPSIGGSLGLSGTVSADWANELRADVRASVLGRRMAMGAQSVDRIEADVDMRIRGESVEGHANAVLRAVTAEGAVIEQLDVGIDFDRDEVGNQRAATTMRLGTINVPAAEIIFEGMQGSLDIAIDPSGRASGSGSFDVRGAQYGSRYSVDGGPVSVDINEDRVELSLNLKRHDSPFLVGRILGDLETGMWSVDGFELAVLESKGFKAEGPVQFTLTDAGAKDVHLRVVSPDGLGNFTVDGTFDPERPDLKLTARSIQLGAVRGLLEEVMGAESIDAMVSGFDGVVSMDLSVGTDEAGIPTAMGWVELESLTVDDLLNGVDLRMDVALRDRSAMAEVNLRDGEAVLVWSKATADVDRSSGRAALDCNGRIRWRSVLPGVRFRDLRDPLPVVGNELNGRTSFDLIVAGPACNPDVTMVGAVDLPVGVNGERVRFDVQVDKDGDQTTMDMTSEQEGRQLARFDASITADLAPLLAAALAGEEVSNPETWITAVDGSLELLDTDVVRLARMAGVDHPVAGTLGGRIAVRGTPMQPDIDARVVLVNGQIGEAQVEEVTASLVPVDEGFEIRAAASFGADGGLQIDGFVPFEGFGSERPLAGSTPPPLDIRFGGSGVPLSVAAGPSGLTDAEGTMAVEGRLTGTIDAPVAALRMKSNAAAFTLIPTGVRYDPVDVDIRVADGEVEIHRLNIGSRPTWGLNPRSGTAELTGTVDIGGAMDVAIDAQFDGFWFSATRSAEVAASGSVAMAGAFPALDVEGSIALEAGSIALGPEAFKDSTGFEVDPMVTIHRERRAVVEREVSEDSFGFDEFEMDLRVDLGQAVRLRADVPMSDDFGQKFSQLATMSVDLGLDGDLRVTQHQGTLSVVGELETMRGEATAFGKRFGIQEGSVTFTGADFENPQLKLDASHRVGQYGTVNISIGGNVSTTQMDLSSPEFPDETDVMSMLLFGKPTSAMSETEGESGAGLLSAAMASAGGKAARATGAAFLQNVQIDPGSGSVKVGFPLTDKVYLSIQKVTPDSDTDNITQAAVEWILSRSTYGEVVTGDRGKSSGDLYWRWRF